MARQVRPRALGRAGPGVLSIIQKHTKPTDRIFTTGPPILYPEANRVSAVRESNIIDEILGSYEGKTDEERLRPIYDQLVKNKPAVVVLDPENIQRKTRHYQRVADAVLDGVQVPEGRGERLRAAG